MATEHRTVEIDICQLISVIALGTQNPAGFIECGNCQHVVHINKACKSDLTVDSIGPFETRFQAPGIRQSLKHGTFIVE